jgi:hypothetical protein
MNDLECGIGYYRWLVATHGLKCEDYMLLTNEERRQLESDYLTAKNNLDIQSGKY